MPEPDMLTPIGVALVMNTSTSEAEWSRNCKAVKAANGGQYPDF